MRIIFIFLTILIPVGVLSQKINLKIEDEYSNPVPFVQVQLLKKEKLIEYGQTDKYGNISLNTKDNSFPLQLYISHLSYQNKTLEINNTNLLNIQLESILTEMEEIFIVSDNYDVTLGQDTIKYNLNKLLNGSEILLKDLLIKLPGITIDQNKKINFQGKVIDKLLIEGSPLYGNNHQLATDYLKSDIFEGVEVLTNYKDKGDLDGFESGQTAVNLSLKNQFKNNTNWDFNGQGDFVNHYQGNGNIFNFNERSKLSVVGDLNNINKSLFSSKDYRSILNKSGKSIISNSRKNLYNTLENPDFLEVGKDALEKTYKGVAVNYRNDFFSKSSLEIQGQTSYIKQDRQELVFQKYFIPQIPHTNLSINNNENARFSSVYLNYDNFAKDNIFWNIQTYYLNSDIASLDNISRNVINHNQPTSIIQDNYERNHNLGINTLMKYNIASNTQSQILFFADYSNSKRFLFIESDLPVFNGSQYFLNPEQITTNQFMSFGSKGTLRHKFTKSTLTFEATLVRDIYKSGNDFETNFEDKLNKAYYTLGTYYSSKLFKDIFTFDVGIDYVYNQNILSQRDNTYYNVVLPYLKTSYKKNKFQITLEVKKNLKSPDIISFLQSDIILDYQSVLMGGSLNFKNIYSNSFQSNFSYGDPLKNTYVFGAYSYSNGKNILGKSSFFSNNVTSYSYEFLDFEKSSNLLFILQKKSRTIPFGASLQAFFVRNINSGFLNEIETISNTLLSKYDLSVQSYFKQSYFNFKIGLIIQGFKTKNLRDEQETSVAYNHIEPSINIFGKSIKDDLLWELNYNYNYYKTTNLKQDRFSDLGFKLTYKVKNYISFFIEGSNLLSLNKNKNRQSITNTESYIQERNVKMLKGYINLGVNFTF